MAQKWIADHLRSHRFYGDGWSFPLPKTDHFWKLKFWRFQFALLSSTFLKISFTSSEISSSCDCFKTFAQLWSILLGPKISEKSLKSRFCVETICYFLVDCSEIWGCWGEMGPYISWKWRENRKKCRLRRKRAEAKMRNFDEFSNKETKQTCLDHNSSKSARIFSSLKT